MNTDTRSPKHRLLDHLMVARIGVDLRTYVAGRRGKGDSWRRIAADVSSTTGEDTPNQTLIDWFGAELTPDGGAA